MDFQIFACKNYTKDGINQIFWRPQINNTFQIYCKIRIKTIHQILQIPLKIQQIIQIALKIQQIFLLINQKLQIILQIHQALIIRIKHKVKSRITHKI